MNHYFYTIFQVKRSITRTKGFLSLDDRKEFLSDPKIYMSDYDMVYADRINAQNVDDALNKLYRIFNIDHPENFEGRSMSMSDLVVINEVAYYVDRIGFKEVETIKSDEEDFKYSTPSEDLKFIKLGGSNCINIYDKKGDEIYAFHNYNIQTYADFLKSCLGMLDYLREAEIVE